jgi:hypothetical protein
MGGLVWLQILAVNWTLSDAASECSYYRGDGEASGVIPVRVECEWPVNADQAARLLGEEEGHELIFSALAESTVLSDDGQMRRVYQVQQAAGVSDRHVILEFTREIFEDGWRFRWSKAEDQSSLREDGVEVAVTEGLWEITRTDTGMRLHYELRYLPGGRVPVFLMSWFQGMGTRQVIGDLRESLRPFSIP